jgi:hypothetical protein
MHRMRWIFPVLVVATAVVALSTDAHAGGRRPRAKIESVVPVTGQRYGATLVVCDREARDLPIRIEYRVRGIKGWQPATIEQDLSAVASSEEGTQILVVWNAWEDLGAYYSRKARLRTIVDVEKGKKKKSRGFRLHVYGETSADALSAATYPDLIEDGRLDDLVLIDTRDPDDFAAGRLPGAIHLSTEELDRKRKAKQLLAYPRDTRLVFYCYGGL